MQTLKKQLLLVALVLLLPACGAKDEADARIQALCDKDGGEKVYETIRLPARQFDKWGVPRGKSWNGDDSKSELDPDYYVSTWSEFLQRGDTLKGEVEIVKHITRVRRSSDRKLLAEAISYGRSGGDSYLALLLGGHPSGRLCPQPSQSLLSRVFIPGG
jgi:hypothetical protein